MTFVFMNFHTGWRCRQLHVCGNKWCRGGGKERHTYLAEYVSVSSLCQSCLASNLAFTTWSKCESHYSLKEYSSDLVLRFNQWHNSSLKITWICPSSRCTHHHSGASGDSGGCWHYSCAQLSGRGWAYSHDRVVPPGPPTAGQRPLLHPVQQFPEDQQCPEGGPSWIWMCGQKLARISAGQGHSYCTRWARKCIHPLPP